MSTEITLLLSKRQPKPTIKQVTAYRRKHQVSAKTARRELIVEWRTQNFSVLRKAVAAKGIVLERIDLMNCMAVLLEVLEASYEHAS